MMGYITNGPISFCPCLTLQALPQKLNQKTCFPNQVPAFITCSLPMCENTRSGRHSALGQTGWHFPGDADVHQLFFMG